MIAVYKHSDLLVFWVLFVTGIKLVVLMIFSNKPLFSIIHQSVCRYYDLIRSIVNILFMHVLHYAKQIYVNYYNIGEYNPASAVSWIPGTHDYLKIH